MGFALDAIRTALSDPGDGIFRDTAWLEESWERPEQFAEALRQYHLTQDAAPLKSDPRIGYDFYHDLVLRHVGTDRQVLFWVDGNAQPQRLSYAQLHTRCTERRADWLRRQVMPGQKLCVLANLGAEFLVSLMTGLRLGMKVCVLPPCGSDFVLRRLEKLSPNWIAMAPRYLSLLRGGNFESRLLLDQPSPSSQPGPSGALYAALGPPPADATSHTYEPTAVALRLFAPTHDPPDEAVEVGAAEAYQGALRDGMLLFGLAPGQVLAAPAQDMQHIHPALLFAAMLRGATFLHLTARDFEGDFMRDDPLANLPPISVLMVNATLRATMLKAPLRQSFKSLRLWVNSPQEEPNPNAWNDWVRRWGLESTPAMSVLFDASCGGSVLFSLRRLGTPPGYLMPAPGRPFSLLQPDDSGDPARTPYGIFQPAPHAISLLLSRIDGGYLYAGTRTPTRDGMCYPKSEVEDAVSDLSFVRGASVVQEPGDRGSSTLLIFTGPETQAYAKYYVKRREQLLRAAIMQRLTPDYMPARIIVTSQLPRLLETGKVDHMWCAQALLSGELRRRAQNPVFALFDRLLLAFWPTNPGPPRPLRKIS